MFPTWLCQTSPFKATPKKNQKKPQNLPKNHQLLLKIEAKLLSWQCCLKTMGLDEKRIILTLGNAAKSFPSPLLIFSVASKYICGSRMKGEEGEKQSVKKETETRDVP